MTTGLNDAEGGLVACVREVLDENRTPLDTAAPACVLSQSDGDLMSIAKQAGRSIRHACWELRIVGLIGRPGAQPMILSARRPKGSSPSCAIAVQCYLLCAPSFLDQMRNDDLE